MQLTDTYDLRARSPGAQWSCCAFAQSQLFVIALLHVLLHLALVSHHMCWPKCSRLFQRWRITTVITQQLLAKTCTVVVFVPRIGLLVERAVKKGVFNLELLKSWKVSRSWNLDILKSWNRKAVKSWKPETLQALSILNFESCQASRTLKYWSLTWVPNLTRLQRFNNSQDFKILKLFNVSYFKIV